MTQIAIILATALAQGLGSNQMNYKEQIVTQAGDRVSFTSLAWREVHTKYHDTRYWRSVVINGVEFEYCLTTGDITLKGSYTSRGNVNEVKQIMC